MFLNYLRIQFLRFFKGRAWKLALLVAVIFNIFVLLIGSFSYMMTAQKIEEMAVDVISPAEDTLFVIPLVFNSIYLVPFGVGIMTINYVTNYYTYRTHINLEIKLRNRILFAISEEVILIIMMLMMLGVGVVTTLISMLIGGASLTKYLNPDNIVRILKIILFLFLVYLTYLNDAYFFAKLFRTKLKAILTYVVYATFSFVPFVAIAYVAREIEENVETIEASDSEVLVDLFSGQVLGYVYGILFIQALILFSLGVILFHRRYEERKK